MLSEKNTSATQSLMLRGGKHFFFWKAVWGDEELEGF